MMSDKENIVTHSWHEENCVSPDPYENYTSEKHAAVLSWLEKSNSRREEELEVSSRWMETEEMEDSSCASYTDKMFIVLPTNLLEAEAAHRRTIEQYGKSHQRVSTIGHADKADEFGYDGRRQRRIDYTCYPELEEEEEQEGSVISSFYEGKGSNLDFLVETSMDCVARENAMALLKQTHGNIPEAIRPGPTAPLIDLLRYSINNRANVNDEIMSCNL
ncbi:hypothetical protein GUITHDRAFT_165249 [Guillardia theta CCMP2712]|uniref:Uncharacterized protein n=1 Tax=Guillardia theta (strain CCMP2712) TaxID=905079 RepID=L1IQ84_GUITC|nr:hypothetical protein GUITHDRAFT_165249 [Guillardia theta CCMP2712]EKX38242.1 hypothetical protein GUITHDRAFT_165249 [Guillardia theta CCMP2712]|eukprot:XP_005825222.1 hypothetical protein GUITHDRAFT_165249 [Guillardia theta CCMP2712]